MIEIVLDRPGKNALDAEGMHWLLDRLRAAAGEPVLLTGAGDAFSAGLNLKEVASLDEACLREFLRLLERTMTSLYLYSGPTVALVNGHAIAGGCVLTLCCDHRVIAADAKIKIGLNEAVLGIPFPPRILSIVKERVPRRHHTETLLEGRLFDVEGALRTGLVDEIAEDAGSVARARLGTLAVSPKDAYARIKRDLRGTEAELCSDEAWERWALATMSLWTSPALHARIAAVLSHARR